MPYRYLLFLFIFLNGALLIKNNAYAQSTDDPTTLQLRNGELIVETLPTGEWLKHDAQEIFNQQIFRMVTFSQIPTNEERVNLKESGLNLLDYLDGKTYFAALNTSLETDLLMGYQIRTINKVSQAVKLHPQLYQGNYPEWARSGAKDIAINMAFFKGVDFNSAIADLGRVTGKQSMAKNAKTRRVNLKINIDQLGELAGLPYVMFIEPIDEPAEPENYSGRTLHRSNVIASDAPSGRKYDGTGITVGMHDDGVIGPHIDYEGRIPIQFPGGNNGDHGDHVAGTIMGAGNLDPKNKGMAFGADLFVYGSSNNNYDSVTSHYLNDDVIITSKSYSNGCNAGYTTLSRELDQYVRLHPSLMHVFSAGNDGTSDCGYGAGANWGNITGGHKAGKNVIAVANLTGTDALANSSSRGPASDGRIKPDVAAKGSSVVSTSNPNLYVTKTGTSMSCPGVSGSLAQLYHAYKELNAGNNPPSGLMKGIMLNSADDLGNPGPDFRYGWGRINNLRAVELVENIQYISGSINQNDTNYHDIIVPANVQQLKVMVYWNDYEASSAAANALVNNIDFQLQDPGSTVYDPWVLDPTPTVTALNSNATRGVDDLNNMEQVTIDNPTPGIHTAAVAGKLIPQGAQEYFVVYVFIRDEITVTYPNGGESLVPGESELIRWDAFGTTGNFTVEYSTDNGLAWNTIGTAVGSRRYITWSVPNLLSGETLIRVSRGSNTDVSDTTFSVIRVPQNLQVDWSCPDSLQISWNSATGATAYEVSQLGNKYMDSIATTTQLSAVLKGIQPNQSTWFSVKAFGPNGIVGRRAVAIEKPLGTFNCPISDDASASALVSPTVSIPDCKDNTATPVTVAIKNEGLNTINNVPLSYQVNNGAVVSEVYSGTINSLDTVHYTFNTTVDLSNLAIYTITTWTGFTSDQNEYNDTTAQEVESFGSEVVQLPWSEDFETFSLCGFFNNCEGTNCNLSNGWFNHENLFIDDIDWRTDEDGTRTDFTGPDVDHNPGTEEGNYLYTEVSGDCSFKEAYMLTPCIDLSATKAPELSFWYHMTGTDIGSLNVDVLHNGQWDFSKARFVGSRGNLWLQSIIDLSEYAGDTINLRFRAQSSDGPFGDIAIDDLSLVETDSTVGIAALGSLESVLSIYPNPSSGMVYLSYDPALNGQQMTVTVSDVQGRAVKSIQLLLNSQKLNKEIDLTELETGVYFIQVEGLNGLMTEKLVVQH